MHSGALFIAHRDPRFNAQLPRAGMASRAFAARLISSAYLAGKKPERFHSSSVGEALLQAFPVGDVAFISRDPASWPASSNTTTQRLETVSFYRPSGYPTSSALHHSAGPVFDRVPLANELGSPVCLTIGRSLAGDCLSFLSLDPKSADISSVNNTTGSKQCPAQLHFDMILGMDRRHGESLTVVGLFAGIGGIELGLSRAEHRTEMLCEIDPGAQQVLKRHFPIDVKPDVCKLRVLPSVDLIAAGFPCQDLSQAGRTAGIDGSQSSLIGEVFKRLRRRQTLPRWLLFENVPFMLQLQRGKAMRYIVDELEELGFTWAYRVVDARAFGIPQRRHRVLLLASRTEDPRPVLFGSDAGEQLPAFSGEQLCGFFWTEGLRGLGWAVDAVPTLKGGSTIGIPSPPAIWDPIDHSISTPDLRDAERLQGFDENWSAPALEVAGVRRGHRWRLVGNAVSVPVAQWIGERLANPSGKTPQGSLLKRGVAWPKAAWGHAGEVYSVNVSMWPVRRTAQGLREFLQFPRAPLSYRAACGFLSRALVSGLTFQDGFLKDVELHIERMRRIESGNVELQFR